MPVVRLLHGGPVRPLGSTPGTPRPHVPSQSSVYAHAAALRAASAGLTAPRRVWAAPRLLRGPLPLLLPLPAGALVAGGGAGRWRLGLLRRLPAGRLHAAHGGAHTAADAGRTLRCHGGLALPCKLFGSGRCAGTLAAHGLVMTRGSCALKTTRPLTPCCPHPVLLHAPCSCETP